MTAEELWIYCKTGGAALVGSVTALKGIPGNWKQKAISLLCSLGAAYVAGAIAMARYGLEFGDNYHTAAVWAGGVFGLIIVNNVAIQIPSLLDIWRRRYTGDNQDAAPKP